MTERGRSTARTGRRLLGSIVVLALLGAVGSVDYCRLWAGRRGLAPVLLETQRERGPIHAGAGRAPLDVSWPRPLAGYGPYPHAVDHAQTPLEAQALVLEVAPLRVAIVSLDLLLVPGRVAEAVQGRARALGVAETWVVATHAHTSVGSYDPDWLAQVAGLGRYDAATEQAVEDAALRAVQAALASVAPATLSLSRGEAPSLSSARDGQPPSDARVTRLRIAPRDGKGPMSQLVVLAAHPTLVERSPAGADADYPARLAQAERPAFDVTLVLQGGGGNAMATPPPGEGTAAARESAAWAAFLTTLPSAPLEEARLAYARVRVPLPCPEARRLAPFPFRGLVTNALCLGAPHSVELSQLEVGPLRLLSIPGEPTYAAARRLEAASGAARVVSLAGGYLGYVELPERVGARTGEARRQYFGPELLGLLEHAAAATSLTPGRSSDPSRAP